MGPLKQIGEVLQQDLKIAAGAGRHSVMKAPNCNQYGIVYHRRPLNEKNANWRYRCIEEIFFDENGFINQVPLLTKE